MIMYGVGPVMRAMGTMAHGWNNAWVASWLTGIGAVHYAIPLPFFYRYMLLCR